MIHGDADEEEVVSPLPYPWFERETYAKARELMDDGEQWPATYDTWRTLATRAMERLAASGIQATPVPIDPVAFVAWCELHGHHGDSDARLNFAAICWRESRESGPS